MEIYNVLLLEVRWHSGHDDRFLLSFLPWSNGYIKYLFLNHEEYKFSFLQSRPDHFTNKLNVNNKLFLMRTSKKEVKYELLRGPRVPRKATGTTSSQRTRDLRVHCSFRTTNGIKYIYMYVSVSFSLRRGIKRKRLTLAERIQTTRQLARISAQRKTQQEGLFL